MAEGVSRLRIQYRDTGLVDGESLTLRSARGCCLGDGWNEGKNDRRCFLEDGGGLMSFFNGDASLFLFRWKR